MSKKTKWMEIMKSFSLITQLGLIVVICIFGCGFLGIFIDKKIGTTPLFSIIFIIIGIGSAFSSLYRILRSFIQKRK
ncbi:AtpZ/AtpI family protein [Peptostreptococcus canis]|uniref:AtpZ/AtpI family protein n=1 Tax=Peptostreptococcus canis TaxID=1159213 RepID=A0ABR6TLM7_9FIRM|nr:AtpZ/AtpI family protein [Peptostreptococcus canis]MBC2576316.1 AtpZ/AtpI family protein [Peptostreptococcus canis]MBP1998514.1 F0F1-type ATP synthase assembly protein I [Peptostreptococcus canis]